MIEVYFIIGHILGIVFLFWTTLAMCWRSNRDEVIVQFPAMHGITVEIAEDYKNNRIFSYILNTALLIIMWIVLYLLYATIAYVAVLIIWPVFVGSLVISMISFSNRIRE